MITEDAPIEMATKYDNESNGFERPINIEDTKPIADNITRISLIARVDFEY